MGLELAGPADENVYVGIEDAEKPGHFWTLPFYEGSESAAIDYDVEGLSDLRFENALQAFPDEAIVRRFGASVDEWEAGDLTFRIVSPPRSVPDPSLDDARDFVAPGLLVEIVADNRRGSSDRRVFFGYAGSNRAAGMRILDEPGLVGVGQGTSVAIATNCANVYAGLAWQPESILTPHLRENLRFMLGSIGLLVGTVAAGESRVFRFAVGFYRDGTATTGIPTRYLYRRYFDRVEDVLQHTLAHADQTLRDARTFDRELASRLSEDRCFMAAQAIRSYYGSTQLLERADGRPLWVVNEGEYRMMNTFDLTVDQAFYELAFHPWTVRNVLDLFIERYAYLDSARLPGLSELHPGGIAFTHDMGVANNFSPSGHSGYELAGLHGCFSFMSAEELMNWVLTASLYVSHTGDLAWARGVRETFVACLESLENRDHSCPSMRTGVVTRDAARCLGGAEITTYDSLDASLGQARNNLYLAVKGWASYLGLAQIFGEIGLPEEAGRASDQAERAAATIIAAADGDGLLPAVIGEGIEARIIPAIEALIYPHIAGICTERFSSLTSVLRRHFEAILQPGICLFPDGGWRLSSTSRNSWLSKIYLCQYVAEEILGHEVDKVADAAHRAWLLEPENAYYAWSDQMLEGKAVGSRYYPRGVTSILWTAPGLKQIEAWMAKSEIGADVA